MRFMMFMYPESEEKDWEPSVEVVEAMSRYNEELRKAGMLLSLDGLRPPGDGGTVRFAGDGEVTITDGPFTEAKEVVGGYWLIQARSKEEALEWASRCPGRGCAIEVRRVAEMEDFPEDVQEAVQANEGF
ncbi:MAG TPA: YciI family protein [Solirubrobacterales bacterium]|nr:YciI family protein [Solirubrobacterales bacterium]